ncbi:Cinnamoyl-CoA reductase 1-like [Melia azedarach]|uniref:Cinnamoyl-CoA reductase 1-like n=1 Tax=Melia azedarach TaxID=155640 RepID=A0ACC1Y018_MELAZ|nr:Cinnamoyl-CoA reductase 1-like [Melia azedarach]
MNSGEGKAVCVTGASGFIGSWLVKQLLERDDPAMTEHLRAFDGAEERLNFFKANFLEEGSFDSAVDGCDGIFHLASPLTFSADDPESIKRVVVTSSMVAIADNGTPLTADVVVDETWFSKPDVCRSLRIPHVLVLIA